jgi:hypothetical protein
MAALRAELGRLLAKGRLALERVRAEKAAGTSRAGTFLMTADEHRRLAAIFRRPELANSPDDLAEKERRACVHEGLARAIDARQAQAAADWRRLGTTLTYTWQSPPLAPK